MNSSQAKAAFEQAEKLFHERSYAKSLGLLSELDQEFPNTPRILFAVAACLEKLGSFVEAEKICDRLLALNPSSRAVEMKDRLAAERCSGGMGTPAKLASVAKEQPQKDAATPSPVSGRRKFLMAAAVAGLVLFGASGAYLLKQNPMSASRTAPAEKKESREVFLGKPAGKMVENSLNPRCSKGGCQLVWVEETGGKRRVVVDGKPGPEYETVHGPVISDDGRRVAYIAGDDTHEFVVLDGQPGPGYSSVSGLTLSKDGKHAAYSARKGSRSPWLGGPKDGYTLLPPDAMTVAVIDGQPGNEYDDVQGIIFSDDGRHAAYTATIGDMECVVADGRQGPVCDYVGDMAYSHDGMHLAYSARTGNKDSLVVDGTPGPGYDEIGMVGYCHDDSCLVYTAKNGNRTFMVADGKAGPEYDEIMAVFYPHVGPRFAYSAMKNGKYIDVVDGLGETGSAIENAMQVCSPDGKRVACAAKVDGKYSMTVDGQKGPAYDMVGMATFSPDSRRIAYYAQTAGQTTFAVVDGDARPAFNFTKYFACNCPNFSPDSRHVAYIGRQGVKAVVMVDDQAGPKYDEIVCGPLFLENGCAEYIGKKGDGYYRVQYEP